MKTLMFILFGFVTVLAQVKIDSSYTEYLGNKIYELNGFATFQQPVLVNDYSIGFRFSQDKDKNTYVPMGSFTLNQGNRKIHWITEIVNPPLGDEFFVEPSIIPVAEQKKFEVTDSIGRLVNLLDVPGIDGDLSDKIVTVGDRVQYDIFATGKDLEYEWFFRVMIDSVTWGVPNKINGATSSSFQTPPAFLSWNGRKYFVRVFNSLGEVFSRESLLTVLE